MEIVIPLIIIIVGAAKLLNWLDKPKSSVAAVPANTRELTMENTLKEELPAADDATDSQEKFQVVTQKVSYFLNNIGLKYSVSNEGTLYHMMFGEEKTEVDVFIRIDRVGSFIKFNSILCQDIPDSKMMLLSELVTRLNENMLLGHFNIFYEQRTVTYESAIILYDLKLTNDILRLYLDHCQNAPYDYGQLFQRVIENEEEPLLVMIDFHNQREINPNVSIGGAK